MPCTICGRDLAFAPASQQFYCYNEECARFNIGAELTERLAYIRERIRQARENPTRKRFKINL